MGYETTLIFIANYSKKPVGYHRIIASVEMGKVAYDEVGKLINELQKLDEKDNADLKSRIEEYTKLHNEMFNSEGEYTEKYAVMPEVKRKKAYAKYFRKRMYVERRKPYIFHKDNNKESFMDSYGNMLLVTDLKTLKETIEKDLALSIEKKEYGDEGYHRFHLALSTINYFLDKEETAQVVLYGH